MSSLERKVERNQLKKSYEVFKKDWNRRRARGETVPVGPPAEYTDLSPTATMNNGEEKGTTYNKPPPRQLRRPLGPCPTFSMYVAAYKNAKAQAKEAVQKKLEELKAQDQKIDTSWEE